MKYDDDELAEAALLLAHVDADQQMPRGLEDAILRRAADGAAGARLSTTKAGSVVVDEPEPRARVVRPASFARTWGGWLAAAACFSFVVYQWRVHSLAAHATASTTAAAVIALRDPSGAVIGHVAAERAGVTVTLPANDAGERYELWLSTAGPDRAVAVGAFVCKEECRARSFSLRDRVPDTTVHRAFITRNPAMEPPPTTAGLPSGARIVGEGSDGTR